MNIPRVCKNSPYGGPGWASKEEVKKLNEVLKAVSYSPETRVVKVGGRIFAKTTTISKNKRGKDPVWIELFEGEKPVSGKKVFNLNEEFILA